MSIGNIKDYTPNYKFIIPKFDTATWHDYIESNFRSIDALLYNIFVVNGYKGEWMNSTLYEVGSVLFIGDGNGDFTGKLFKILVEHTTPNDGNFETFYENNPDKYEQFADFDAAERAAQLAKDWANKMSGTVDGLEYSAKYYAELAQQTLNSKANDNEVVHLADDETITGTKTFTQFTHYQTNIAYDETPSSNKYGGFNFLDKNGAEISAFYSALYASGAALAGLNLKNKSGDTAELNLRYNTSGTFYTEAPAPTDTTTTSGTQIATTGWVNSVGNNVMHLTDYENITGYKSFQTNIEFDSIEMIQGTNGSGYGPEFYDKNLNRFGFLRPQATTSTNVLSLCATRIVNGTIKYSGVDPTVDSNGNCYVVVPTPNANSTGREAITANWVLPNYSKATNKSAETTYTPNKNVRVIIAGTIQNSGDRGSMEARVQIGGVDKITLYGGYVYGYNEDPFFVTFDVRAGVSYEIPYGG